MSITFEQTSCKHFHFFKSQTIINILKKSTAQQLLPELQTINYNISVNDATMLTKQLIDERTVYLRLCLIIRVVWITLWVCCITLLGKLMFAIFCYIDELRLLTSMTFIFSVYHGIKDEV